MAKSKTCGLCDRPTAHSDVVHRECHEDEVAALQTERDIEKEDAAFDAALHAIRYRHLPNYRVMCNA